MLDGVAKSPIYYVSAGTANARRTICTPPCGRRRYALYIELLCLAVLSIEPTFYEFIMLERSKRRFNR